MKRTLGDTKICIVSNPEGFLLSLKYPSSSLSFLPPRAPAQYEKNAIKDRSLLAAGNKTLYKKNYLIKINDSHRI